VRAWESKGAAGVLASTTTALPISGGRNRPASRTSFFLGRSSLSFPGQFYGLSGWPFGIEPGRSAIFFTRPDGRACKRLFECVAVVSVNALSRWYRPHDNRLVHFRQDSNVTDMMQSARLRIEMPTRRASHPGNPLPMKMFPANPRTLPSRYRFH